MFLGTLECHQANQGSLRVSWGTWNCSAWNAGESGLITLRAGSLIYFLELQREPGVYSQLTAGMAIQLLFVQRRQDSCLATRETSGISSRLVRAKRTLLEVRLETKGPFLVASVILGFLSIFNKSQALSPFEALNSTCLSWW